VFDPVALDLQREQIERVLRAGLVTNWNPRAETDADVRRVTDRLQSLAGGTLEDRLREAGMTLQPYAAGDVGEEIEQACRTCMYFESHNRYCNLPELKLGVEPDWSCILWRI
jgi:hypothetical protein